MPQIMPILWTLVLFLSLSSLLIVVTLIYFFYCPTFTFFFHKANNRPNKNFLWNWKW